MKPRNAASAILPVLALAFLWSFSIIWSEGVAGFAPLANIEGVLLVGLGTLLCLWIAHPFRDIFRSLWTAIVRGKAADSGEAEYFSSILRHAADVSVGMGAITALLGMIILLNAVEDVTAVPRRLAFLLASLFYGLILSECVFIPLSRRLLNRNAGSEHGNQPGNMGRRRLMIAFLTAGAIITSTVTVLWALQQALDPQDTLAARYSKPSTPEPDIPGLSGVHETQPGPSGFLAISLQGLEGKILCSNEQDKIRKAVGVVNLGAPTLLSIKEFAAMDRSKLAQFKSRVFYMGSAKSKIACLLPEGVIDDSAAGPLGIGMSFQMMDNARKWKLTCAGGRPLELIRHHLKVEYPEKRVESSELVERLIKSTVGERFIVTFGKQELYCEHVAELRSVRSQSSAMAPGGTK